MERCLIGIIALKSCETAASISMPYQEKSSPGRHALNRKETMRTMLYWIEGPWTGRLAISPRPRGGDWLEEEIRAWRQAGVDVIVSLLTPEEVTKLDLGKEGDWCQAYGLHFFSFPIVDRGIPVSRRASVELVRKLDKLLTEGKSIAVHCRQGIGRSALLAACLLIVSGEDPETAFQRISAARGYPVPETTEQRAWVRAIAAELPAPLRRNSP